MQTFWAVLLATAACLGCSGASRSAVVSADEFVRACSGDQDCIAVRVGDLCGCGCDTAGIAASEERRYQDAAQAVVCGGSRCSPNCVAREGVCDAGVCDARSR